MPPHPRMCGSRHCWAILQSALSAFPVLIPMLSYPCKRRALTFPSNCSPTLLPMVVAALLCASHSSTAPDTGELYTRVLQSGLNATSCPHSSKTPPNPPQYSSASLCSQTGWLGQEATTRLLIRC